MKMTKLFMRTFMFAMMMLLSQQNVVPAYQGLCSRCINAGYNYCNSNNTCVDNRPGWCGLVYDKPFQCIKTLCSPITIVDADLFA